MKRIGYVYKYSEDEQKGILVYGQWKKEDGYNTPHIIQDEPIKFSIDNCIKAVKTGQLVYFELKGNDAINIERASLANFDTEVIEDLITWKKDDTHGWYDLKTHILYERLNDIIIPKPTVVQDVILQIPSDDSCSDETIEDDELTDIFNYNYRFGVEDFEHSIYADNPVELPNSIDDLFDCFGKYKHVFYQLKNITATIDILDIDLWVDEDILNGEFYGSTVEQLSYLCDIFIYRKRINENGKEFVPIRKNNCIPETWKHILSKLNNQLLRQIISENTILQPVLPYSFCKENLDVLTDKYGMPNLRICKTYCKYQIEKTILASEYEHLKQTFHDYTYWTRRTKGEGAKMHSMGKKYIEELITNLENRFETIITENIKTNFNYISSANFDSMSIHTEHKKEDILSVGYFIEAYEDVINKYGSLDELYYKMPTEYQSVLYKPTCIRVNNSIIEYSKCIQTKPSDLESLLATLKDWVLDSTISAVIQNVKSRFAAIEDLHELETAYANDFIDRKQFIKGFYSITKDYDIANLGYEINTWGWHYNKPLPLIIQWYIISRIIDLFNFKSLNSYKKTNVSRYGDISDIRTLLSWINYQYEQNVIDKLIVRKAESRIISVLTEAEKWILFEEELISSPGIENIKKKLSDAYEKNSFDEKYLKKECFQDVMYQDILSSDSIKHRCLIAEQLDEKHLNLLQNKSDDELKLITWITIPYENCDWSLIFAYFTYLPDEQQIKIFRYLFSLIAQKKIMFSIDDLYDIFVEIKRACPAICGVIYLLKEKISDSNAVISSEFVERIIGCEDENKQSFLLAKTFFYACNGHLSIKYYKIPAEYYTTNGRIDKINVQGADFYAITFDEMGMEDDDGCFEDEYIIQAKSILELNIKTKVIDGKYIIDTSEEMALKQFIIEYNIEDYCGIIDSEYEIINKKIRSDIDSYGHYLTPYDKYKYHVCRNINCSDIDPENGMPFYWCNKKPCARRCHYIQPTSQWEQYKFSDFLYILLGCQTSTISQVWDITSEVSQFMHDFITAMYTTSCDNLSESSIIYSHQGNKSNEIGRWTEDMSIIHGEDDVNYDESEDDSLGQDAPTYNRYRGSYAQDVMGYSDDDIDDIFEGDPDAYWNID